MYECPNGCDGQRFVRTILQAKQVLINERGEVMSCQAIGEPNVSDPRCTECGAEAEQ